MNRRGPPEEGDDGELYEGESGQKSMQSLVLSSGLSAFNVHWRQVGTFSPQMSRDHSDPSFSV